MLHLTSIFHKPKRISGRRDFPYECGRQFIQNQISVNGGDGIPITSEESFGSQHNSVGVARSAFSRDRLNEVVSIDVIVEKAGFIVPVNTDVGKGRFVSSFSKFRPSCGSKVKPLSSEEVIRLIASQSRRSRLSASSTCIQRKLSLAKDVVGNQRNSSDKSSATALRGKAHEPSQNREGGQSSQIGLIPVTRQNQFTKVLSPREKVLKVIHRFKTVFEGLLDRNKVAGGLKTAANKIHYRTRDILMREGMQVNSERMIGRVPGIEVGDEFHYKSELSLIGLHSDIRGGIDYTNIGDLKVATSIISSEDSGYIDRFNSDEMIYCGQGGNLTGKEQKVMKDHKLVRGNLALVQSMWRRSPVRVIFGKKRLDDRRKRYVYDGLYLVQDYWEDIGPGGNIMLKFQLSRVPGQPSTNLRH